MWTDRPHPPRVAGPGATCYCPRAVPPRTPAGRWLHALKVASWPKLLVPALLGQVVGAVAAGRVDALAAAAGLLFTALDLAFIVLVNDWADRDVDAIKRRMFPDGCSPKTIPDGLLPGSAVLLAGLTAGALAVGVAWIGERALDRDGLTAAAVGCLAIFAAYSLPPLRLNYRGGGELLEALGVGAALPWWHAYLQGADPAPALACLLPGFVLLSASSAIASGLSDERSDRAGGKRTIASLLGNAIARRAVEATALGGALAWAATGLVTTPPAWWVPWPAVALVLAQLRTVRALSPRACTDAFSDQRVYKLHLHRAIWRGTTLLAAALTFERLVSS